MPVSPPEPDSQAYLGATGGGDAQLQIVAPDQAGRLVRPGGVKALRGDGRSPLDAVGNAVRAARLARPPGRRVAAAGAGPRATRAGHSRVRLGRHRHDRVRGVAGRAQRAPGRCVVVREWWGLNAADPRHRRAEAGARRAASRDRPRSLPLARWRTIRLARADARPGRASVGDLETRSPVMRSTAPGQAEDRGGGPSAWAVGSASSGAP